MATINGVTQSYDAAGNLTGNGSTTWTYNARGRLASAKLANAAVYNYGINGLGQRVSKSGTAVSTGRQIYVYDEAGHLVGEYNNTGTPVWEHVYLGDFPVAVIASNGTVFPVLSDHLGTPRQVINSAKQLRWRWDNVDPFGANLPNQNPAGLGAFGYNLRFPGQYFDSETGLHYNYFRDYNPKTGGYIESDPIGLSGGLNTYGYVENNPLSFVDPQGLERARTDRGRDGRGRKLTPCYIYYLVDCNGEIVYVGISSNLQARDRGHSSQGKRARYGCPQCPLTMVPNGQVFNSRKECENAETNLIRVMRPIFNDRDNPDTDFEKWVKRELWRKRNCQNMECK